MRRALSEFYEGWQSVRIDEPEFIEAGEHVVVPWTAHFVGRDGIEVQARSTWLIRFRDGKQTSLTLYQTKQDALVAAGLSG